MQQSVTAAAPVRYDGRTIALHWATAVLVVLAWLMAQYIDDFPRGPLRVDARSVHITLGVAVLVVLVARIVHRSTSGWRLPPADRGPLHVLAKATHYALYVLLAAQVTLGVSLAWTRGDSIFNVFALPGIQDRGLRSFLDYWHGTIGNTILILAGFHAAAALFHHYVWKDGVLRRMIPVWR